MTFDASAMLDILRQEKEVLAELVKLSNIEQKYIMQNDIEGLLDITKQKERLALVVRELEKNRSSFLNGVSGSRSGLTQSLSSLISEFDQSSAGAAEKIRKELLSVLTEFNAVNQTNSELLKRNLDYVSFMLDTLLPDENPMYTSTSNSLSSKAWLFDGKA